ncbi:MAG: flagellar biosynthesis protein FlhB [Gammaproteobacteria bacterium (ex Lamellibrachia satsuma)]|nr:MAG: flagellar type III secretion system protein FlhB [Gammaproteobacteria bacterium (ex Lamellibrachia satsuma)]RRS34600.1 MAG: flagellar biosynthesis protein FlhB [Gammaproteobacteria bacterium (ex Lamellibrachia satsuma)]RRS37409.1 MAG: flagellar biosynthesis protein FlhB [Gammaproteobacteria bacterium (ex Lamellibrachia satsuma)]
MAENQDGQEKSEQPTAKRLNEAKRKGQVARSKELNTMAITLIGVIFLATTSNQLGGGLQALMKTSFTLSRDEIFDIGTLFTHLSAAMQGAFILLVPFFVLMIVVAIASSIALGGFSISAEALTPKLSKLSPAKGLKRMFSAKALVELLKAMAKFVLIGGATAILLWNTLDSYLNLHGMEFQQALPKLGSLIGWSVTLIASTLILIAAIDVPFQLWEHKRQLKMTKQEIRDEMKETDGRPEVKSRIRSLQREMAQRRMMEEVPKADVIVTNPTHYAVALRYDQGSMSAPKVVAKGADLVAANIRRIGLESDVPIVESPVLARAIYFHSELGEAIPAGLFLAVAKLLAYVFQLRVYRTEGGDIPQVPDELPVPEDLRHD